MVENFGIEKFMIEKSWVERSGVEVWGCDVFEPSEGTRGISNSRLLFTMIFNCSQRLKRPTAMAMAAQF